MFPYTRVGVEQGKCLSNVHTILLRPSLLPFLNFCVALASIRLASVNLLLYLLSSSLPLLVCRTHNTGLASVSVLPVTRSYAFDFYASELAACIYTRCTFYVINFRVHYSLYSLSFSLFSLRFLNREISRHT